jgi:hypothetical protein
MTTIHTQITIAQWGDEPEDILAGNIVLNDSPATVGLLVEAIRTQCYRHGRSLGGGYPLAEEF